MEIDTKTKEKANSKPITKYILIDTEIKDLKNKLQIVKGTINKVDNNNKEILKKK